MRRASQGGSILGFVVIGVVLASLLVGGIYVVKRQIGPFHAPAVQTPQQPAGDKEQSPPSAESGTTQPNPPSSAQSQPNSVPVSDATQLPTTGPKETAMSLIILGLLSGVVVSYLRSRRPQLSL